MLPAAAGRHTLLQHQLLLLRIYRHDDDAAAAAVWKRFTYPYYTSYGRTYWNLLQRMLGCIPGPLAAARWAAILACSSFHSWLAPGPCHCSVTQLGRCTAVQSRSTRRRGPADWPQASSRGWAASKRGPAAHQRRSIIHRVHSRQQIISLRRTAEDQCGDQKLLALSGRLEDG